MSKRKKSRKSKPVQQDATPDFDHSWGSDTFTLAGKCVRIGAITLRRWPSCVEVRFQAYDSKEDAELENVPPVVEYEVRTNFHQPPDVDSVPWFDSLLGEEIYSTLSETAGLSLVEQIQNGTQDNA